MMVTETRQGVVSPARSSGAPRAAVPSAAAAPFPAQPPAAVAAAAPSQAAAAAAPAPVKVNIKNILCSVFEGTISDDEFDSGVRTWWRRFEQQVDRAQTLSATDWPDKTKEAVLGQFLGGMADRWYLEFTDTNPNATFEECGDALMNEFRPALTNPEVMRRISEEYKRPEETYREFADRLITMGNAVEGGMLNLAVGRQVVSTFVRHAYPRHTDAMKIQVNLRTDNPYRELTHAVDVLTVLAESDGKKRSQKRRQQDKPYGGNKSRKQHRDSKPKDDSEKEGKANLTIDRKHKPSTYRRNNQGSEERRPFLCHTCKQPGHSAWFHAQFLAGKVKLDPIPKDDEKTDETK